MEALRAITLLCLSMHLSVLVKTSDLKQRSLLIAETIRQLQEGNGNFRREDFAQVRKKRSPFVCPLLSPSDTTPTSVHKLRPGDINVVAALGDSLTAGRAAKGGLLGILFDYRGYSWSIGGQDSYDEMPTLPNILRMYNPNLQGYSKGIGEKNARFNVAKTGATSNRLLEQAQELVRRLRADPKVNMAEDWKVITILIGANDLCRSCTDEYTYSAANYKANLQSTLDYLKSTVPRAFVNLLEVVRVDFVAELANSPLCEIIHAIVCDCAANPKNSVAKAELIKLEQDYQAVARELAASSTYSTSDDFAVVLQPLFRNTTAPHNLNGNPDFSYFGGDCFHFSKKGQVAAAEGLWNNMVEPVGSKRTSWTPDEIIECPTENHPFLYTAKNSDTNQST